MIFLRSTMIVSSILFAAMAQSANSQENVKATGQTAKTRDLKTSDQDKPVAGKPDTRTKVEVRKSSQSSRAKGDINFDDLQFKIEKDASFKPAMLTDDVKKLDGVYVKLRGYILPSTLFKETNIDQFVLVRMLLRTGRSPVRLRDHRNGAWQDDGLCYAARDGRRQIKD